MKKFRKKHVKEAKRFSKYLVGGNAQFWSGYGAYALLDVVFSIDFWPAKIAAYFVGASVNFFIERYWAFADQRITRRQVEASAQRFYTLMFVNFILDLAIVGGLRELGLTPYIGQFVSAGFFTGWNYLLFKFWVFRQARRQRRQAMPSTVKGRRAVRVSSAAATKKSTAARTARTPRTARTAQAARAKSKAKTKARKRYA